MKTGMKFIIAIFFICNSYSAFAQQKIIDSLQNLLKKENAINRKARLSINIGKEYISSDTLKAKQFLTTGLELAEKANDDMGKGMFHLYTAYLECNKGLFKVGILSFDKASEFFNAYASKNDISEIEKKENTGLLLDAELSRGNVYLELYEYEKAIDMFWKVLKVLEMADFPDKQMAFAATYQSIALAYYHREQYQTALQYYLKAVPFADKSGNEMVAAESTIYAAMCYTLLRKYDSSSFLLNETEPRVLKIDNAGLNTIFYARKAELLRYTEKWQEADNAYEKAIGNAKKTGNIYMQATFTHARARCLLKLNKIDEARKTAEEALDLSKSINKKREILESQKVLSLVEAKAGNYTKAYKYLEEYTAGNDSLHTKELTEKIQALDKKYQTELKEDKISKLEKDKKIQALTIGKKNIVNYIFGAAVFILLGITILTFRNYKQKQKIQQQLISELEMERKLSATEAVLKGEEQERTRLAKDLHDGLGGMLSGIKYSFQTMKGNLILTPDNAQAFERSMDMLDGSIKEMRRVAHNMMPEVLHRYGLSAAIQDYAQEINNSGIIKVIYQSMGDEKKDLEQSSLLGIYRIVQELINNAIKHSAASEVLVQVYWQNGKLVVNVEDNGKGFDISILEKVSGIGWKNIRSRIELLKGNIDIHSSPDNGTFVNIEFMHI